MIPEAAALELSVDAGPGADDDELERLAHSLRAELLELDLDSVEPAATGPAPDDARAVEALMIGALVVRLSRDSEALSSLVRTVRGWLGAHADRRVRIELDGDVLELAGPSDEERQRLVDAWIERHGRA
ncbi:MAG TPA: hypothetical protein VFV62_03785 [Gaiellaceae bacterium]|nr:hypothetical protein [Gaiellaceae bacterium]